LTSHPQTIYLLDLTNRTVRFLNQPAPLVRLLPMDKLAFPSTATHLEALAPESQALLCHHAAQRSQLRPGESLQVDIRLVDKGSDRWLRLTESLAPVDTSSPLTVIGVAQEITEQKLTENRYKLRLRQETLLSTISSFFVDLQPEEFRIGMKEAMKLVCDFTGARYGLLLLHPTALQDSEGFLRSTVVTVQDSPAPQELDRAASDALLTWVEGHDLLQLTTDARLLAEQPQLKELLPPGIASALVLPLEYNLQLIGALVFGLAQPHPTLLAETRSFLRNLAETVANTFIQKRTEEALRRSEARYRTMIEEHQTEMICRMDAGLRLTFANQAFCSTFAVQPAEATGMDLMSLVHPEDRGRVQSLLATASSTEPVLRFETRANRPSDELCWQEWAVHAIFDHRQAFVEYQAVGHDITARKHMEAQISSAQSSLTQSARLASIGQLASSVAHTISNPLTVIIAEAQILLSEARGQRIESLQAIVNAGWRAQNVINELLKFSEPEPGSNQPVSINETIEKSLLLSQAYIQASGIELQLFLAPDLPEVWGNEYRLIDLWTTLFLLARSATLQTENERVIQIETRELDDQRIGVEITDNGFPIPEDQLENIFEIKLLPAGSNRNSGIEMSLCREIVRQHQGTIAIESSGGTTRLCIEFPRMVQS
jgi:PAS domain S-box-containing protein